MGRWWWWWRTSQRVRSTYTHNSQCPVCMVRKIPWPQIRTAPLVDDDDSLANTTTTTHMYSITAVRRNKKRFNLLTKHTQIITQIYLIISCVPPWSFTVCSIAASSLRQFLSAHTNLRTQIMCVVDAWGWQISVADGGHATLSEKRKKRGWERGLVFGTKIIIF